MATIRQRLHYRLNNYRRHMRFLFPSPAEMKFVEVMGGWVVTVKWLTWYRGHYPLSFVLWRGRLLRREYMKREVRCGPYYCDFWFETPYNRRVIEVDGYDYHLKHKDDIVYDQRRDEYMKARGIQVLRIDARDLWRNPAEVQKRVKQFLSK